MQRRPIFIPGRRADFGDLPPRIYRSYRAERDRLTRRFWAIAAPVALLVFYLLFRLCP